jgi:hypothetical protein
VDEWVSGVQTKTGRGGPCMGRQVAMRYEQRVVSGDIKNPPVDMTRQAIGMCIHLHPRTNLASAPCNHHLGHTIKRILLCSSVSGAPKEKKYHSPSPSSSPITASSRR